MKTVNFILQGFGFISLTDFKISTFGHLMSFKVLSVSITIGIVQSFFESYLGLPLLVLGAFVILNIMEYATGIMVAKKKKKIVESRKMGRMFLKVFVYMLVLFMLQSFKKGLKFPEVLHYELDPFIVLYWAFLTGIIYQLFKSLLENLVALGYSEAKGVLGFVTRKFGSEFKEDEV